MHVSRYCIIQAQLTRPLHTQKPHGFHANSTPQLTSLAKPAFFVRSKTAAQVQLDSDSADGQIGGFDYWDLAQDLRVRFCFFFQIFGSGPARGLELQRSSGYVQPFAAILPVVYVGDGGVFFFFFFLCTIIPNLGGTDGYALVGTDGYVRVRCAFTAFCRMYV